MSKKNRPNSQANILRDMGTPALGTLQKSGKLNNPLGRFNPPRDRYRAIWTHYDLYQYCSYLRWTIPENAKGLTSWNLNRMLYFHGSLGGFEYEGNQYVLPYAIEGELNPYGAPTQGRPLTYNGGAPAKNPKFFQEKFILDINNIGSASQDNKNKMFILYDAIPCTSSQQPPSRYVYNSVIIDEIAETLARININVTVSNKKIMLVVKDVAQREIVEDELRNAFGSDSPFAILSSPLEVDSVQASSDYNADDLFNTVKNWDAIRCFTEGIDSKNFGTEKKERLVSGELAGNESQINLVGDMRLAFAQDFCDNMNAAFGGGWAVEKQIDKYTDPMNGRGNTKLEEEEEL